MDRPGRAQPASADISLRGQMPSTARVVSDAPGWRGQPQRLPQGFRVTKPNGEHPISAVCEVWSHPDGWELRIVIEGHGLLLSVVVPSAPKMLARVEKWRAAMLEKGWS